MGLDFNKCDAHWSYGGFNGFRKRLAQEIGINLEEMKGFTGDEKGKNWEEIDDPIVGLLNHSDCDGELSPQQCQEIAPRLRELVKDWSEDEFIFATDKERALELARGMEKAVEDNEPLEFC